MNPCRLIWVVCGVAVPLFLLAVFGRAAAGAKDGLETSIEGFDDAFPAAITTVTITPARPDAGDLQRMDALRKNGAKTDAANAPVYIAKIYFSGAPPVDNEGFTIWAGDQLVKEYGSFKGGIFFKIYDKNESRKITGKEISVKRRGKTIKTGKNFPDFSDSEPENQTYPSVAEVLSATN